MLRYLIFCLSIIAAASAQAAPPPPYAAGFAGLRIGETGDPRPLSGHIWYPAVGGGQTMRFAENPVWRGFDAYPNAPLADGRFPLVVMSHGLGGNAFNQAWLAMTLAEAGFIVAAPNHPGTTTFNRDAEARAKLWERPRDISRTISAMLAHPIFGRAVAADRIAAIGHSLGGYTVLALAGARYDAERHAAYCTKYPDRADCVFVREAGIGSDPATLASLQASLADPRISAIVSFDLGLTQGFDPASLAAIEVPVLIVGAARGGALKLDAESRALAAALPAGRARYVEPAGLAHYDFLGLCKPGAVQVLKEEDPGEEFVCEPGGVPRDILHERIIVLVKSFLRYAGMEAD